MIKLLLWFVPWLSAFPFRRRTIYRMGKPYLTRIYLTPSTGALGQWWRSRYSGVFLHCFHMSDPDGLHDHPWLCSRSLILRGAYFEQRCTWDRAWGEIDLEKVYLTSRVYWPGHQNFIFRTTWHRTELLSDEVWTLFRAGPRHGQGWGFSTGRKGRSDDK